MCLRLGYPHPDYLLRELTSEQLTEWIAYNKIDPIGQWREDYKMSYMAAVITNCFTKAFGKRNSKMVSTADFKINWEGNKAPEVDQRSLTERLLAWAHGHNAAVDRMEKKKEQRKQSKK